MSRLILDRYEPLEPKGKSAGQGVSGVVIRAKDTWGEHGTVAIKRPNPMLSPVDNRKKSAQIKREGEALRRLKHPNACRYISDKELPDSQGHYLLIMEWARGKELETRLRDLERTGERFPLGEALEILDQLASLLAHAHESEVIHNDIDAKHLFWDETNRQLTVIDWANCALGSDARPIATEADDLNQYGQLMHRFLTGATLDSATRLGKERGWRVEMQDKKLDPVLQKIVARSVGRDEVPYSRMRDLATELRTYKQEHTKPFQDKVIKINSLLTQESTYETLAQAKELINQVSRWDPTLVRKQRAQLEQIELERAQNLALVRAKVSMRNEEWETARQRIERGFGTDPSTMSLEARWVYWSSLLLDQTELDSPGYELRKAAASALLFQEPPAPALALDHILLSYGSSQPDYDPFIAELARQTEQPYPPLRSRFAQAQTEVGELLDLPISDQLRHYHRLREEVKEAPDSARYLLDDLVNTLQEADSVAEYGNDYEKVRNYFHWAFRVDPQNYRLYSLSKLMDRLAQATQSSPDDWQKNCDQLAAQDDYSFAAAQYYLDKAKERISQYVKRNIEYMRQFRLDTAWTELENAKQERSLSSPLIESTWLICIAYRYLYGYSNDPPSRVQDRLQRASKALNQARQANIEAGPALLGAELEIATTLVQGYSLLYETGLLQLESVQLKLGELPYQEEHRLIRQLQLELDRLGRWKDRYEFLLDDCSQHHYASAAAYVRQYQETDKDQEAFQWLDPTKRPAWSRWQELCQRANEGLDYWHKREYLPAYEKFNLAGEQLPIYIDGQAPRKLKSDLVIIANELKALHTSLAQSQNLLATADSFETYQPIPDILRQAVSNETELIRFLGGESRLLSSVELSSQFVQLAQAGQLENLQSLIVTDRFAEDPLLAGYQRIAGIIGQGMELEASVREVETALKLAPASQWLKERQVELEKLEKAWFDILQTVHRAEIDAAQGRLTALKNDHPTLPRPFSCLEHLLSGYGYLSDQTEVGRSHLATDRISSAQQSLGEAQKLYRTGDRAEIGREIEILTNLIGIYRNINQQGLDYLETARTKAGELQGKLPITETHEFISRLATDISGLEQWRQRRTKLFADLKQHHYAQALNRLEQMGASEKSGLQWLDEAHQPNPASWKIFCNDGQKIMTLWQNHSYGQAAAELATFGDKLPAGLPAAMSDQLQDQFKRLATDLETVAGHVTKSRNILEEAEDASAYIQVDNQLSQAQIVEATYSPHPVGNPSITSIQNRYRSFKRLIEQKDLQAIARLIDEARQAGDPLVAGYEHISGVVEVGNKPKASSEEIEAARRLIPGDALGLREPLKFKKASGREVEPVRQVVDEVLAHIHKGDLEAARQQLDDSSQGASFDCLEQICAAYGYLYGQVKKVQSIQDRLDKARQTVDKNNCAAVEDSGLKQDLEQEREVLDVLIWAYNGLHTRPLSELRTIGEEDKVRILVSTHPDHAFVRKFIEDLEALNKFNVRWERVANYWRNHRYGLIWGELKETTQPEKEALVWRSDTFGLNWNRWQSFRAGARQISRHPLKLVVSIAVVGVIVFGCYQLILFSLAGPPRGWSERLISLGSGPVPTSTTVAVGPVASNPESEVTATATALPEPTMTATPTVRPEPTATHTSTPAPTTTDTATPPPTATPPALIDSLSQTNRLDIMALGQWQDQTESASETPTKIYTTPPDFWHVVTGNNPHTFWVDREFQQNPFEFKVSLSSVVPDSSYGIALRELESGQVYSFQLSQGNTGPGQFSFTINDELIESGPVLAYDFAQSERAYNSISVRVIDNFIALIVNDEEQVYVYQAPEEFGSNWNLGLYAGPDSHAIIGSAYLFELNPG